MKYTFKLYDENNEILFETKELYQMNIFISMNGIEYTQEYINILDNGIEIHYDNGDYLQIINL